GRRNIAPEQRARRDVRCADRAGEQRLGDGEVRVVAHLDPPWDALLERAPIAVAEPRGDIPHPRRLDPGDAARADQLVEEDVGERADEHEVMLALTDELVREREWDRGLERAAD